VAAALPCGELVLSGHEVQTVAPDWSVYVPCTDHSAVKPLRVPPLSDVNVTLRKPVDELYTLDGLRNPASLRMRSDESSHVAVSQR
jgi:hypothetical protein